MRVHQQTGKPLRQIYEDIESQTGIRPAQLDGPSLPEAAYRIWGYFQDLTARRRWHISAGTPFPEPISYQEIHAYLCLSGVRISSWQLRLLAELDNVFRATVVDVGEVRETGTAMDLGKAMRAV